MTLRKRYLELTLLLLSFAIFLVALSSYAGSTKSIPGGENGIKSKLDQYFRDSILFKQFYAKGWIDAGTQGIVTRSDLEKGKVAVIRYGNPRKRGATSHFQLGLPKRLIE